MSSSDDSFDAALRTGSIKRQRRKLQTPRKPQMPIPLVFSASDDEQGDSDSLEHFLGKLRVTPKPPPRVPLTPMRQFIVPDHESDDESASLFEKTTITMDDHDRGSDDDNDDCDEHEQTIRVDDSEDEKENSRPIKMRLPSGQDEPFTLSDDSDEVFTRRVDKDRARAKLNSWKTPDRKKSRPFSSKGSTMTPEQIYKKIRTPQTADSPAERRLKKEIRREYSPVYKAKKAEEERKLKEQFRVEARHLLEAKVKRNECNEGVNCVFKRSDGLLGKQYQLKLDDIILDLYSMINRSLFKLKLPRNLAKRGTSYVSDCGLATVTWNKKLKSTAGRCRMGICKDNRLSKKFCIELAPHILTSGQRLRDTFLHELIHAANWMIDLDHKAGHGPLFRKWGVLAKKLHPEIPPVSTKHSYEINYKYWWECSNVSRGTCTVKVGRKSKSLDVTKVRCAKCKAPFVYVRFKYYQKDLNIKL